MYFILKLLCTKLNDLEQLQGRLDFHLEQPDASVVRITQRLQTGNYTLIAAVTDADGGMTEYSLPMSMGSDGWVYLGFAIPRFTVPPVDRRLSDNAIVAIVVAVVIGAGMLAMLAYYTARSRFPHGFTCTRRGLVARPPPHSKSSLRLKLPAEDQSSAEPADPLRPQAAATRLDSVLNRDQANPMARRELRDRPPVAQLTSQPRPVTATTLPAVDASGIDIMITDGQPSGRVQQQFAVQPAAGRREQPGGEEEADSARLSSSLLQGTADRLQKRDLAQAAASAPGKYKFPASPSALVPPAAPPASSDRARSLAASEVGSEAEGQKSIGSVKARALGIESRLKQRRSSITVEGDSSAAVVPAQRPPIVGRRSSVSRPTLATARTDVPASASQDQLSPSSASAASASAAARAASPAAVPAEVAAVASAAGSAVVSAAGSRRMTPLSTPTSSSRLATARLEQDAASAAANVGGESAENAQASADDQQPGSL